MNTIPVTILDNFLDNPDALRNFALTLEYFSSPKGNYPGKRTICLSNINPTFFNFINKKILNLFFPDTTQIEFNAFTQFHLSKSHQKIGYIHQDSEMQITAIIYLSPFNPYTNNGTSFFNLKKDKFLPSDHVYNDMPDYYLEKNTPNKILLRKEKWEKENFNKVMDVKDEYNRLLAFDPSIWHANNATPSSSSLDRLTLITFISTINSSFNYPVTRNKQNFFT